MSSNTNFSSKLGVIAATVGSAVGLGTVWRFPSVAQENGGSVFLITYLLCVFLMGIPVMLAEFTIGRGSRMDALGAFRTLTPNTRWWIVGVLGVLAPYLILMYYMVVAGWTLEYLWLSISGDLFSGANGFEGTMNEAIRSTWSPIFWTAMMIFLNLFVLLRGVKKGIEKMSNILMPLLFVILLVFCGVSLQLPNAMDGVKYFLKPDFSKFDSNVLISALGQAFFSLSLGMGILITYSSYYPSRVKLAKTSFTVSSLVFLIAVLMGLIIFPAMRSFGIEGGTEGTTLVFITLPQIFTQLPMPQLWAILFFALLVVAALTSTVSVAEVPIALICTSLNISRKNACLIVLLPMLVFCSLCSLSMSGVGIELFGMGLFDFLDFFTSNILLPIVAFFVCIYVGYVLPKKLFFNEITNNYTVKTPLAKVFFLFIRFVAPLLILLVFINSLFL